METEPIWINRMSKDMQNVLNELEKNLKPEHLVYSLKENNKTLPVNNLAQIYPVKHHLATNNTSLSDVLFNVCQNYTEFD